MKKPETKLNITLSPETLQKIKDGNYNRNKLIISLLEKHIKNFKK
jgi:hypothetical protein